MIGIRDSTDEQSESPNVMDAPRQMHVLLVGVRSLRTPPGLGLPAGRKSALRDLAVHMKFAGNLDLSLEKLCTMRIV